MRLSFTVQVAVQIGEGYYSMTNERVMPVTGSGIICSTAQRTLTEPQLMKFRISCDKKGLNAAELHRIHKPVSVMDLDQTCSDRIHPVHSASFLQVGPNPAPHVTVQP